MKVAEVAKRYAKALFELGVEAKKADLFHQELIAVENLFSEDSELKRFALSPLVKSAEKENALEKALEKAGASSEIKSFLLLLAQKGRLPIIHDVVVAYQTEVDQSAGVVRGRVRTAHALGQTEQKEVTDLLAKITQSEVILDFGEEESLVGGLTAQVGSLTIDDSIQSHLNRMRDDLNRSVN